MTVASNELRKHDLICHVTKVKLYVSRFHG